jgi:tetratricopeptide (TPR) repeat protein
MPLLSQHNNYFRCQRQVMLNTVLSKGALVFVLACLLMSSPCVLDAQTSGATAETHVGLGYEALKKDQYEEAANEFRAALALDPSLVLRARFPLGVALFEAHKAAEARKEFALVRAAVGPHPNISYYLGRLDIDDRNYAAAIRNLKQAILKPPFPDTSYYLGFAYLKQGNLALAVKYLVKALKVDPEDARISYQLAQTYKKQGRDEEARRMMAFSEKARQQSYDRSIIRTECRDKLEQGPTESARTACERLYDSNDADTLTKLGSLYGQHGMLRDALKAFIRASELAPHSPQTQYNLALTYYQLNEFQQARTPLAKALKRWPDLFPLNALYGAVLLQTDGDAAAAPVLRYAHKLNPQDAPTTDLLYGAIVRLAQRAEASADSLKLWTEAASLRPGDALPHQALAQTYAAMGNTAEAGAERERANQLSKGSATNTEPH